MAELIASLNSDALNPLQININNNTEYAWNTQYMQEQITQFFFQIVRTKDKDKDNDELEKKFQEILHELFINHDINHTNTINHDIHKQLVYRMIAHTRDVVAGKGEYELAYMMIYNWAKYNMGSAVKLITHFVSKHKNLKTPYGSWKDVKYFSSYCRKRNENHSYKLYKYLIGIMNIQLIQDMTLYEQSDQHNISLSLCAKWVPRENKAHGWMYEPMALDYYERIANKKPNTESGINYAKMYYRKILSKLNKHLDTVQIKMCNKNWQSINFDNTTSITLNKNQYAFSYKEKSGAQQSSDIQDRLQCAENFSKWCNNSSKQEINGKHVSMYDFVKTAYQLETNHDENLVDLLNKQWESNKIQNNNCKNKNYMIPIIDNSLSMYSENKATLYTAIGLGIRIAEQSKLGKRCIVASHKPKWINLEDDEGFYNSVMHIKQEQQSSLNMNISATMEMILHHIKNVNMTSDEVEQLTIIILSNMQFSHSHSHGQQDPCQDPIDKTINDKFADAGKEICGIPYKPPRIVFWNLEKTNGFPTKSFQPGFSMISGYSPQLINSIVGKSNITTGNEDHTPYNVMKGILNGPRYKWLQV